MQYRDINVENSIALRIGGKITQESLSRIQEGCYSETLRQATYAKDEVLKKQRKARSEEEHWQRGDSQKPL
jgi:ketol-acid reductoisomerase